VPSLYEDGWRQGTLFNADLAWSVTILNHEGQVVPQQGMHGRWAVVSQDCTLNWTDSREPEPVIELRPGLHLDPPTMQGVRSRKLLLGEGPEYLEEASPRVMTSGAALSALKEKSDRTPLADPNDVAALKLWLGKRYDRPAVPDELVPLARRLAKEVKRNRRLEHAKVVRDVFFQADLSASSPTVQLYALVRETADPTETQTWLADIALSIPPELGVVNELQVGTSRQISLSVVENSYSADVSDITWGQRPPEGAY